MPEETATASQPQSVPGSGLADLLDDEPETGTGFAEETPEPADEDALNEGEADEIDPDPNAEEADPETAEEDANTIPRWLEDLELTPEELASWKKRYPSAFKNGAEEDLRYLIRDRVRDHRDIQARRAAEQVEEPTLEQEAAPANTQEQRKAYYEQIDNIVSKQVDQSVLQEWGQNMLDAMGVDVKSTDPEIQAIVRNAPKLGTTMAKGALDLIATVLPNLLPSRLDASLPGLQQWYTENVLLKGAWESVRSQEAYKALPEFNSPEWNKAVDKVLKQMPELRDMYPNLPPQQRFEKQYVAAAKLMIGQKPDVTTVRTATEAGKQLQRQAEQKRTLARTMGSGRSKGQLATPKSGNDDLFGNTSGSTGRIL